VWFPIFNNGKLEVASFGKEVLKELKEMEKVVVNGELIAKYWYILVFFVGSFSCTLVGL
jgi:hypothetical protein